MRGLEQEDKGKSKTSDDSDFLSASETEQGGSGTLTTNLIHTGYWFLGSIHTDRYVMPHSLSGGERSDLGLIRDLSNILGSSFY